MEKAAKVVGLLDRIEFVVPEVLQSLVSEPVTGVTGSILANRACRFLFAVSREIAHNRSALLCGEFRESGPTTSALSETTVLSYTPALLACK